jgi:SAM-dependent methyltransferase
LSSKSLPDGARARLLSLKKHCSLLTLAALLFPSTFGSRYRKKTFQRVYLRKKWGVPEGGAKFFSGSGSRGPAASAYVDRIGSLIEAYSSSRESTTIVDLGCGDFEIGRQLTQRLNRVKYIGCDIVPELIAHHTKAFSNDSISFKELDIVNDALPSGEICLIRQVFQHLSNEDIACVLVKFARYQQVFVTEGYPVVAEGPVNPNKLAGSDVRFDWDTGRGRGVELDKPPYNKQVEEIYRVPSSATEVLVTFRVHCR